MSTPPTDIIAELEAAFYDIPFENSDFQTKAFVLAQQITPARAYRALGLQISSKIRAIKELKYSKLLEDLTIEEKQAIISEKGASSFEGRRATIEIEQIVSNHTYTAKLLNDAIHTLNVLYSEFKKYPTYTRESFEAEEGEHFTKRLEDQIRTNNNGAIESLTAMANIERMNARLTELTGIEATNVPLTTIGWDNLT